MKLHRIISVLLAGVLALSLGVGFEPLSAVAEETGFDMAVHCSEAPDHSYTVVTISLSGVARNMRLELSAKDMVFVYEPGKDDHNRSIQVGDLDASDAPLELAVGIRGEDGHDRGALCIRAISDDQPIKEYNGVFDCRSVARALVSVLPKYDVETGTWEQYQINSGEMMAEVFEHCCYNGAPVEMVTGEINKGRVLEQDDNENGAIEDDEMGVLTLLREQQIDENDITYIYICAHGSIVSMACYDTSGEFTTTTYEEILDWLAKYVPGRVVLLLDACHSGTATQLAGEKDNEPEWDDKFADRFTILTSTFSDQYVSDNNLDNDTALSQAAEGDDHPFDGRDWSKGYTHFAHRLWDNLANKRGGFVHYTGFDILNMYSHIVSWFKNKYDHAMLYGEGYRDMFVGDPNWKIPVAPAEQAASITEVMYSGIPATEQQGPSQISEDEFRADIKWNLNLLTHRAHCTVGLTGKADHVKLEITATDVSLDPHDPGDPQHLTVEIGDRIREDRGEYGLQVYDAEEGGAPALSIRISAEGKDALEYRCDFDAQAQPRALLVAAPGYYEANDERKTPEERLQKWFENDLRIMKQALGGCYYNGASVEVETVYDPRDFLADDCLGRLKNMAIDDNDITYVLLDAHGLPGVIGLTSAPDTEYVMTSYGTLLSWLQQNVSGKVVLIISSCFGGSSIDSAMNEDPYFFGLSEDLLAERFVILTATSTVQKAWANAWDVYEHYIMDLATLLSGRDNPVGDVDIITSDILKAWTEWENLQVRQYDMAPQVMSAGNDVPVFMLSPEARCPVAPRPTNERFLLASQIEGLQTPRIEFDPVVRWEDGIPVMAVGEGNISWYAGDGVAYYHVVIAQENGEASNAYDWEAFSQNFEFEPQDAGQTFAITVTAVPVGGTLADGRTSEARFRVTDPEQPITSPSNTTSGDSFEDESQHDRAVLFGTYEQDNDYSNGPEPIEWLVLERESDYMLLMARDDLDCVPFNDEAEDVTWENCTLRYWLNHDFLETAFTEEERSRIIPVEITNGYDGDNAALLQMEHPQSNTVDSAFILSWDEFEYYHSRFPEMTEKRLTPYAEENTSANRTISLYGLRSMSGPQSNSVVGDNGQRMSYSVYNADMYVISTRPVICVRLQGEEMASGLSDAWAGSMPEVYQPILEKYYAAVTTRSPDPEMEYLFDYAFCYDRYQGPHLEEQLGYCLRDLNGDGLEELILGSVEDSDYGEWINQVYTVRDGRAVALFNWNDYRLANRETAMIWVSLTTDGMIVVECSDMEEGETEEILYRVSGGDLVFVRGFGFTDYGSYRFESAEEALNASFIHEISEYDYDEYEYYEYEDYIGIQPLSGNLSGKRQGGSEEEWDPDISWSGENDLLSVLENATEGYIIQAFEQADYDGDGIEEAFALAVEQEDDVASLADLWFVQGSRAIRCETGCCYYVPASEIVVDDDTICYQVIEGYEGPGSQTRLWTCDGSEPMLYDGEYMIDGYALDWEEWVEW